MDECRSGYASDPQSALDILDWRMKWGQTSMMGGALPLLLMLVAKVAETGV